MSITRPGDFKSGGGGMMDARSVHNESPAKGDDNHVEQMRQKIGTGFTADQKRDTGKKRNELGKDDFMRLMSAQLKYQDPVSPMKNEAMAAQLAQFSALEQMLNVNQNLEKMTAGQKPSEHMIAASLIGKRVTTDTSHFSLEKGASPEITFELPDDATAVNVAVVNGRGEVVREFELGEMQKGPQAVRWDGKNSKAQAEPLGEYSYKISAADKDGKSLALQSDSTGIVTGVTFEGGKSLLLVDGKKVSIESVGRIEGDAQGASKAAASAAAALSGAAMDAMTDADPGKPSAKPLAAAASKQSSSKAKNAPQSAKNNLPPDLTPEKINSMLASMGMARASNGAESAPATASQEENPLPLWNPANN